MIPTEIEAIIRCFVEDLELMDEFCNQKQFDMVQRTKKMCNTIDHWDVDRRMYHPLVENEIYSVMANSISGCYRQMVHYIRALAFKVYDTGCAYHEAVGFVKEHKLEQTLFLFEYGQSLMPEDFKAVCNYFFNENVAMMKPGHIGFNQLIPLAFFCLNDNPFLEPVQFAMNHFMRNTLTVCDATV
jgi:hypothetical protein